MPRVWLVLVIASLVSGLFGVFSTWILIGRLRRIAATMTRFMTDQYDQRLPARATGKIGQIEAHFNGMAEQLVEHIAREKILVEQNARLEEQARLARNQHDSVRQQLFGYIARGKLLAEQNARLGERARLARDLHDSVKQQLFALAVQVELARSLLEQDRIVAQEHLCEADNLSYQIQQELTTLIHALHPPDLQTKGLATALRDYVTNWSRQNSIVADLSLPENCPLPSEVEEALWRVTQEALSNVARHSQASSMQLQLGWTEQHVSLSISDNGRGFELVSHEHKGSGLCSMRERIAQIGGTILIQNTRGVGTLIAVHCSLSTQTTTGNMSSANEVSV